MKKLLSLLPHLSIALTLALTVLVILDVYNPMLGLLRGRPFLILFFLSALAALGTALLAWLGERQG